MRNLKHLEFNGALNDISIQHVASGCQLLENLKLCVKSSVGDGGLKSFAKCVLLRQLQLAGFANTDVALSEVVCRTRGSLGCLDDTPPHR